MRARTGWSIAAAVLVVFVLVGVLAGGDMLAKLAAYAVTGVVVFLVVAGIYYAGYEKAAKKFRRPGDPE